MPEPVRDALTRQIERHLESLLGRLAPDSIAFCWPYRAEPDLRAWVGRWLTAAPGRRAALPVVVARDQPMSFREWAPGHAMETDRFGIPHPASGAAVVPELVLVPLNAFDAAGFRLGYGGGYFDRTLAALPMVAVGVGFEIGRVPTVLPQAHDRPMDWLVTEAGCAARTED